LHHPSIAHHKKLGQAILAMLGQLHEGTEARGIDEVDPAQVDHHRQAGLSLLLQDEFAELLVGVGVKLAGETEQQALLLPFTAPAQRDGQSLKVGDCSSPWKCVCAGV
jgi:hypothetical protein